MLTRRSVAAVLLVSVALLSSGCASWHARNTRDGHLASAGLQVDQPGPWTEDSQSYMLCHDRGTMDGKAVDASGSFLGGFCGGFLLGLIGTAVAAWAQGQPEPPAMTVVKLESEECRYVYTDAYRSAGKRKKQDDALFGGLLGTGVSVTLLLVLSN